MKKILSLALCLALLLTGALALLACGKKDTLSGDYSVTKAETTIDGNEVSVTKEEYESLVNKSNRTQMENYQYYLGQYCFDVQLNIKDSNKTFSYKESSDEQAKTYTGTYTREGNEITAQYKKNEEATEFEEINITIDGEKLIAEVEINGYLVNLTFEKK